MYQIQTGLSGASNAGLGASVFAGGYRAPGAAIPVAAVASADGPRVASSYGVVTGDLAAAYPAACRAALIAGPVALLLLLGLYCTLPR
jgi:hypothetical protein